MIETTLCFLLAGEPLQQVLLGMKKRGVGEGKFNGFGGKVKPGESVAQTAVRELHEEAGLTVAPDDLQLVAKIYFDVPTEPAWETLVHVFLVRHWTGRLGESEEMRPQWFDVAAIPYEQMWSDDIYWLPLVLRGEKLRGWFYFAEDGETLRDWRLEKAGGG